MGLVCFGLDLLYGILTGLTKLREIAFCLNKNANIKYLNSLIVQVFYNPRTVIHSIKFSNKFCFQLYWDGTNENKNV